MKGHRLELRDEGNGWSRAVCTCEASQASPERPLTAAKAEGWHREHVRLERTYGGSK